MWVFIENESGSAKKNLFNEKTLEYRKTVDVSRPYPFPYGFVIGTTSGDGDNLDCFVLTDRKLVSQTLIEVEPIGMFEQMEDGEDDPKILAAMFGEHPVVDDVVQRTLRDFIEHVFEHVPGKNIRVGRFLDATAAKELLEKYAYA